MHADAVLSLLLTWGVCVCVCVCAEPPDRSAEGGDQWQGPGSSEGAL